MNEKFGRGNFIILYSFLMGFMDLHKAYEEALKPFYDEKEIKKRLLFLKLTDLKPTKWNTEDYQVIVDCLAFMLNQAVEYRDTMDKCFKGIDKMMKKEDNYMWNRSNAFVLRKVMDNITDKGSYQLNFTENWDGDFILVSC